MITPLLKISPPQTPHGSPRSTAPARHGRRSGHRRQAALASSRSAGTSENHSHELWAHGSGLLISAARITSTASEVAIFTDSICLTGGPPPERAQHHADAPLDSWGSGAELDRFSIPSRPPAHYRPVGRYLAAAGGTVPEHDG